MCSLNAVSIHITAPYMFNQCISNVVLDSVMPSHSNATMLALIIASFFEAFIENRTNEPLWFSSKILWIEWMKPKIQKCRCFSKNFHWISGYGWNCSFIRSVLYFFIAQNPLAKSSKVLPKNEQNKNSRRSRKQKLATHQYQYANRVTVCQKGEPFRLFTVDEWIIKEFVCCDI